MIVEFLAEVDLCQYMFQFYVHSKICISLVNIIYRRHNIIKRIVDLLFDFSTRVYASACYILHISCILVFFTIILRNQLWAALNYIPIL